MTRWLSLFVAASAALLVPAGPAAADDYEQMRVRLPSNLTGRLLIQIQAELRRQFGMEPRLHGNTLVGRFGRQQNVVGSSPGTGTIVIAFDPADQQGVSVMSVLIVSNLYLANRLSDAENMWRQPSREQDMQHRRRLYQAILLALRRTCRVTRDQTGFVCAKT